MAGAVYLALWATIGLMGPKAAPPANIGLTRPVPPVTQAASAPPEPIASAPEPAPLPLVAGLSGLPGDSNARVGQMQRALIQKGYQVGVPDAFDADTVTALQAFQDDRALTVQPTCN